MQNTNKYSGIVRYGFIGLAATALVGSGLILTFPIAAPAQEIADDSASRAEGMPVPTSPPSVQPGVHFGAGDRGHAYLKDNGDIIVAYDDPNFGGKDNFELTIPLLRGGDPEYNLSFEDLIRGLDLSLSGTDPNRPTVGLNFHWARNTNVRLVIPPDGRPSIYGNLNGFNLSLEESSRGYKGRLGYTINF